MSSYSHSYPFDPSYGYSLDQLLEVAAPPAPEDFAEFWQARYAHALSVKPRPHCVLQPNAHPSYDIFDIAFRSTDDFMLGGWLLKPKYGPVQRGLVIGHGYGGRCGPDFDLPFADTALLFPCLRGISRSRHWPISEDPAWHVLHDIDQRDRYILAGCVEDIWLAVSTLLELFPETQGHVGYLGISFSGGVGALALPWDARIQRAHLNVPTFGHQPLRLELPTAGSGESVRRYQQKHGHVLDTLRYYDAATAARSINIPVHVAAALLDPMVAPPGQFAIYNALAGPKQLFVLDAGHFDYPEHAHQVEQLRADLRDFFAPL